ncbi:probable carboxylesterase 6 [Salvia miltiorrhiza]|uniref:probable carboxylesterase 6 n=1 Tax=Salvia miltiorrhiza TaxID=226208 RepID=UPI0025ABAAE7|nr:probable carboxylesterase 6 [Salvia miltiorrhiza]
MAAMTMDPNLSLQMRRKASQHQLQVVDEIEGLIKVYNDGHVERPDIVPNVGCSLAPDLGVTCRDTIVDKYTNIWARIYVPTAANKLPLLLYFHGGGFCVGAASWSCYHDYLAKLAAIAGCAVVSVNYRLAPEHPLPAAYDDGVKAAVWAKQQEFTGASEWWAGKCDFSRIFLAGDSAGANIAYNVGLRVKSLGVGIKGLVLIQPFFGGEARTRSEMCMAQPPRSALTLAASDAYWRMALPVGAGRDHPWCNAGSAAELRRAGAAVMVCVAEADILRDRNLEFCGGLAREGVRVEQVVSKGVGHAFQILNKSQLAQTRLQELLCHVKNFVGR